MAQLCDQSGSRFT